MPPPVPPVVAAEAKLKLKEKLYDIDIPLFVTELVVLVIIYDPKTFAPELCALAVVTFGVAPSIGAAVPLVHPVKLLPDLPVYCIVSSAIVPCNKVFDVSLEVKTFSLQ